MDNEQDILFVTHLIEHAVIVYVSNMVTVLFNNSNYTSLISPSQEPNERSSKNNAHKRKVVYFKPTDRACNLSS